MHPDDFIGRPLEEVQEAGRQAVKRFTVIPTSRDGVECEVPKDAWRGLVYYVDLVDGKIQQVF